MKKLLATLGLFLFLISPASAHGGSMTNKALEHGKSYTKSTVSCSTRRDVMQHIYAINHLQGPLTKDRVMATIIDNNCITQPQHFTYINEEYICSFSIRNRSFTLLDTEVEGIKQYIIVNAIITLTGDIRFLECLSLRRPSERN